MLSRNFLLGFLAGTLTGVAGYRLYEQNGGQLQNIIEGMSPSTTNCNSKESPMVEPDLRELVSQKERLEDLIAEKEMETDK